MPASLQVVSLGKALNRNFHLRAADRQCGKAVAVAQSDKRPAKIHARQDFSFWRTFSDYQLLTSAFY